MLAIFPRHKAPVVRHAADGERELVLMSWGSYSSKAVAHRDQ
jgi:hypothetical protein